jgi:hypothetical protein
MATVTAPDTVPALAELRERMQADAQPSKVGLGPGPPGRLDVSIDDETYEAGAGCIVVITIRNPFEVPVQILELKQPRSSNLRQAPERTTSSKRTEGNGKFRWPTWTSLFGNVLTTSISFAGIKAELGTPQRTLEINVDKDSTVDIGSAIERFDTVSMNLGDGSKVIAGEATSEGKTSVVLQPHCETNAFLTLSTRGWLFFKPTRLRLKSELRYTTFGSSEEYTQVVSLNFDVRPPLRSVLFGAKRDGLAGLPTN